MDKDIVATIKKRDSERAQRLCDAYGTVMAVQQNYSEEAEREAIGAGLDFLVADYRETAELWLQAKARGGKAQSDDRKTVAAALALLAVELRKPANKVTAETYRQAIAPRPEKRCGTVEQHGGHSWTEWVKVTVDGQSEEQSATYACPGWQTEPRDLSGLQALVAERSGVYRVSAGAMPDLPEGESKTVTFDAEQMTIDPAVGPDFTGGEFTKAMQNQTFGFTFDEPGALPFDPSPDALSAVAAVLDEPPPPGQSVALAGAVLSWSQLREIRETFRRRPNTKLESFGLPEHVSHSQIGTFGECALKGLLTRSETLGVQQLPQWANIGGTAMHLAVERFERMVCEVRQLQYVKDRLQAAGGTTRWWGDAFRDTVAETAKEHPWASVETWRASRKGVEGFTWWLVEGEAMLQRYLTARLAELESPWRKLMMWAPGREAGEPEPERTPMLEHEFVMDVEGVPFKGVIDQVWKITSRELTAAGQEINPGDLVIDDVKSGSTPNDPSQLREYAMWLASTGATGGRGRIWGRFVDVRRGEIASAPFILLYDSAAPGTVKDAWDELAFKVEHTAGIKSSGSFMPRENNYCVACPVKHACPIMAAKL